MSDLQIEHFNVERLFTLLLQKARVNEQTAPEEIIDQMNATWVAFTKWAKMNFDVERTINIPNFGNFQWKVPKGVSEDQEKCVLYFPNENFLAQSRLKYRGEVELSTPTIKISFQQIAKLAGDLDKNFVQNTITGVFLKLMEVMNDYNQVEVDLGQFGKFLCFDKTLSFEPLMKTKQPVNLKQNLQSKKTVRNLIEQSKNVVQQSNRPIILKRPQQKHASFSKVNPLDNVLSSSKAFEQEEIEDTTPDNLQSPFNRLQKLTGQPILKQSSLLKLSQNLGEHNSPTRRFNKPEKQQVKINNIISINLIPEMLGAGTDPLAKNQDFSRLVSNPSMLISSSFQKPGNAKIRFPPILDKFARTLAAPISGMKYNTSVVGRIASNYTPSAKRLYFDSETKGVKVYFKIKQFLKLLREFQSKVNFTANSELLQKPASLEEELLFITGKLKGQEYKDKMAAKKICYQRYSSYISNEIPLEFIAPIRQYWITDILDQIPGDFQNLERTQIEQMIDDMLSEINKNYYESVKKSIVDYVLKDEDERLRIGIIEVIDELDEFGTAIYGGIEPSDEWKDHVNESREKIASTLVVNSKATLSIMRSWHQKYSKMNFLLLSTPKDQPMTIQYFVKIQEDRINEVRTHLHQEWQKEVVDIYQEELTNMNRSKRHALLFFESTATLMSNLLRTLIYESLNQYNIFFKRFDKRNSVLRGPQEIVDADEDLEETIEDIFLIIKLKFDTSRVEFADPLFGLIKTQLLLLIDEIHKCSQNFPRPENNIARSEKTSLWSLPNDDEFYVYVKQNIESILDQNLKNVEGCLKIFDEYAYLLKEVDKAVMWTSQPRSRNDYLVEFDKYRKLYDEVLQVIPFSIRMNMVLVDGSDVKKKYLENLDEVIMILEKSIHTQILQNNSNIAKEIIAISENISGRADVIERLVELEQAIEKIRKSEHKRIVTEFSDLQRWLQLLYTTPFRISEDDLKIISSTANMVHTLITKVDQEENRLTREREELEGKLREKRDKFTQNIDDLVQKIESIKTQFTEQFQIKEANEFIDNLGRRLKDYLAEMTVINQKEDLLGWTQTEFPKLTDASQNLKPFEDLWHLARDLDVSYTLWTKQRVVFKLDAEGIEKESKQMFMTAKKLTFQLKGNPGPLKLANEQSERLHKFQQDLPLIKVFSNPGLKERHWEEISQLIAMQIRPDKDIMLNRLIDLEAARHLPRLEEISDSASKEFNIEKILNKMQEDWDPINVELKAWKDTGTTIVGGASVDEVQTILDDQIVKTITMKGSPYAKIFENRINEWESWLNYTQQLFEYWIKVQGVWLYLEPVFTSPDILKHLAMEGTRFKEVDANWRSIMNRVGQNPKVIEFTKNRKMLETLRECHYSLEIVQKGLNAYLEGKRSNFPRFYFLSNDELLEILSETKDPLRVQPHLKKCFEGIQKLKFDNDKRIHGMYSSEGEYVQFISLVDTAAARGNVDEWLLEVEKRMIQAIRDVTDKAYREYDPRNRKAWVVNRCGMAVLNMDMTYWTNETEKSMIEMGNQGVGDYAHQCTAQLNEIVRMVRTEISLLDRCTLEAMIVLDVHNRDVLNQLYGEKVSRIQEFSWQSQLRYYWIDDNTTVKIINAVCEYNYEYLGNSARLVITPLTDRCYRTLCGAIHLNYGGAPEGPAGTGKTETVKDLAKALARQCVVFNCSDGLDYKAMGKFFKGLASSGAWSCFDEFNRIDLEVLSVVAQQILTIQLARASKLDKFFFEDAEIRLIATCNCFITMNPGYAGRSELPDNLKALFRSVAMMVPDYALIAEISLYSYGFEEARDLARKIVTTYKLCSEQLSSQDHYDYGMRAVKSVLTAAGNLKRKFANENEFILMLRAINDVNLAKFLTFDLPLFKGITRDLFPGVTLPEIDYKAMYECINIEINKLGLQQVPSFIEKVIQLYEMILVRHGLMIVGLPFGGKTSALHVLAGALGQLCERGAMNEKHVQIITLNPKSITMKLLYGQFDEVSHEWYDGILAVKFRYFAKLEDEDRKWLIFDGPIDAVWIENMNTVLDDNKKLCLNSGEIIAMNKTMNMIFEPMDLQAASPATVSRCGMIYMEPAIVGWRPLVKSWMKKLPQTFTQEDTLEIEQMFDYFIEPLIQFQNHQRSLSEKYEISPTQNQNLISSLMRIYRALIRDLEDENLYKAIELKSRINILQQRFLFSMIWSFGGSVSTEFRKPFDQFMKRLCGGDIQVSADIIKKKIAVPERGSLFEYSYEMKANKSDGEWILWLDLIDKNEQYPSKIQPHEILVKTTDTVRYSFLLNLNIMNEHPTLFCGPTGTGKSAYIKSVLNILPKEKYTAIEIGFSAQTTSTQTQDIVDLKLERIRKGVYGPRVGKYLIFVDDLNMPAKEKWGAQPPIEILRQMLDQQGWYDYKDKEKMFKNIENCIFVSAMGPPGGGRTFITPRFLRHLTMVSLTSFDDDTLNRIFGTILRWFFTQNNFPQDLIKMESKVVVCTLEVYKTAMRELLPTPTKSHYLFNLRDFAKVILGVCLADKEKINEINTLARLWTHEVWRVFADRLINDDDRLLMLRTLRDVMRKSMGLNFDTIFEHLDAVDENGNKDGKVDQLDELRGLMFTDCMTPMGAPKRFYEEVLEYSKLQQSVDTALENHNTISDKPMDLVLFSFAVEHLLIIARIMKQPMGNALLVGVGGSGRQSLTRLAAFIMEYNVVQIEISKTYGKNEWHEDLKKLLRQSGGKNESTVFLFTDSQIKDEAFVEDINNLLNTYEVPNLYAQDEKAEITELVRSSYVSKDGEATLVALYNFFIERVKKNLHIVLCFSPIGDAFRTRVRMFPSLVNCCTIDWFKEWPQDALVSVAKKFFSVIEMDSKIKADCTEMVQFFHESTIEWAKQFYHQLKRKYYVTPTSYLELIITFKQLLDEKRREVTASINKYENGYKQIINTEGNVEGMQRNLIQLQPQLKVAAEKTQIKMKEVEQEKSQADVLKEAISVEEAEAQSAVNDANAIKTDCQKDLDEALPALMEAEEALKVLDKKDIDVLKTMKQPPQVIRNVMRAICLLLYPSPTEKMKDASGLRFVTDWWAASIKLLNKPGLLSDLLIFDKDNVDEKIIKNLGAFLTDPEFKDTLEVNVVANASEACRCMIMWVQGVYKFYFVNKKVKPKKAALAEAQAKADNYNAKLAVKQKELKEANDKVNKLNNELQETIVNKERLEKEYEECSKQLERAVKLIENLGGEKGRWGELAKELKVFYNTLTGDVLVASGMIAYLGAFTSAYRNDIANQWVEKCLSKSIPSSPTFSLINVLGDAVKIRAWNIDGLPSDQFSIENAIIIFKARRWPLCIDPQGQANKWIKRMEISRKLQVIKLSDSDYLRSLENAIQFGKPVLLENVLEELDPSLTPVLLKQTFQKGTTLYLKLGENTIEYSNQFQFYITTKLRNPHYLPELSTKVTLLNFMITQEGLNDQLLGILVKKERPDLEKEKERLIVESASNKKQLAEIEQKILEVLSGNKNILTDETAIDVLTASKVKSNEIKEKQVIAEQTEKEIDSARQQYIGVSQQASCLFFAISDLNNIDPMYQYSLVYFIDLFTQSIIKSEMSDILDHRLENLKSYFLLSLYKNICRSLFEKDKLLFSFLLSIRLMDFRGELDNETYRFLLTGGISLKENYPDNPQIRLQGVETKWISQKIWSEVSRLSDIHAFHGLYQEFYDLSAFAGFKRIYDSLTPHSEPLPPQLETRKLSPLHKLCILRTLRPDKIIPAIQIFVRESLSEEFIFPPAFNLAEIYNDSSSTTPLIFVLSPGSDPFASLNVFAQQKGKQIKAISLGQGQGPLAQKMIKEGIEHGSWVVLQNCHLAVSWMPTLEKICEELQPDPKSTNPEFRLWLTSYPSPQFPTAILQAGIKMTNEPPKGLKANLQGSFLTDPISNDEFFMNCNQPVQFKKLLYGLCFFHAVIQERRKYGPLGWNIAYEFNESDLRICVRQLRMFLDEALNGEIPFDALRYLTAECNYGGRVTDDKDRRLICILLEDYYCAETVDKIDYNFGFPEYNVPMLESREDILEHIKQLPLLTQPQVFGFHPNADITKDMNETNLILDNLLLCSSEGGGQAGQSFESVLDQLVQGITSDFPEEYDYEKATEQYPFDPKESMNTVLTQELTRFNKLISIIRKSLGDLKLALLGRILMSAQLERASRQLFDGKVPDLWMEKSYPSLKPLGGYVQDLRKRLKFFQDWINTGAPNNFWISGFFFTQSFLTGVLQNYARKYVIPIDEITFEYKMLPQTIDEHVDHKPDDGAYVWGLFLEGCKWNYDIMELDESDPKVLFSRCPSILLSPVHTSKLQVPPSYNCPIYKTSARRGVLSTTGHSTNFVMWVRMFSSKPERFWVKRGVALLTQLDD